MKLLIDCCAFLPSLHGDFVVWANRLWQGLRSRDAIDLRIAICPDDEATLRAVLPESLFGCVLPVAARGHLAALFGDGRVPARWSRSVMPTPAMRLFREMVGVDETWSPDVIIASTPQGAIRAVWPQARVVFLEMHPFSRPPFPDLFLLDGCSIVPTLASERSPLANTHRTGPLSPSARSMVEGLKRAARETALALAPRMRIEPPLPSLRQRPLAILPLPIPFGFSELVDGSPEACLERVCQVAEACEGLCDLLITQHPLGPVLPPDALAALLGRRTGVHLVAGNDTGCAATNLLCASADLLINLGSKSVYLALLFDLPVIEVGVSSLGALGLSVDVPTPDAVGQALRLKRSPASGRQRDRVLHTLVRHYACTERALSDPDFVCRRLDDLLADGPITLSGSPWASDEECGAYLEEALADAVDFPSSQPSPIDRKLANQIDLPRLTNFLPIPAEGWILVEHQTSIIQLPAENYATESVSFNIEIKSVDHIYLPLVIIGEKGGNPLINRRMAIHWNKKSNSIALSISAGKLGMLNINAPEGSVPINQPTHITAHINTDRCLAFLLINHKIIGRMRIPHLQFPSASHVAIGVDLEWDSPPATFLISDLLVSRNPLQQ